MIFPLFIIPSMKYLVKEAEKGFTCEISYFISNAASIISWLVYSNSLRQRPTSRKDFYCSRGWRFIDVFMEKLNDVFILTTIFTLKRRRKDGNSGRKNMKMTGKISLETSREFIVLSLAANGSEKSLLMFTCCCLHSALDFLPSLDSFLLLSGSTMGEKTFRVIDLHIFIAFSQFP